MKILSAAAAGLVAGLLGAACWAAVAYYMNVEIGWLAWGIGAAVGAATLAGGSLGESSSDAGANSGAILGFVAVVITALSICAGKFAVVEIYLQKEMQAFNNESEAQLGGIGDEELTSWLADSIGQQTHGDAWRDQYEWPADVEPSTASTKAEYPKELWAEAEKSWSEMAEDQRTEFRETVLTQIRENMDAFAQDQLAGARQEAFMGSFGGMDLLFFGLALVTAWRIAGSGEEA